MIKLQKFEWRVERLGRLGFAAKTGRTGSGIGMTERAVLAIPNMKPFTMNKEST